MLRRPLARSREPRCLSGKGQGARPGRRCTGTERAPTDLRWRGAARAFPNPIGAAMLNDSAVTAIIPAGDLERARGFYADKLGLEPVSENPGGLMYRTAGGTW